MDLFKILTGRIGLSVQLLCMAFAVNASGNSVFLKVDIKGFVEDTAFIKYTKFDGSERKVVVEKVPSKEGRFEWSAKLADPAICTIYTNKSLIRTLGGQSYPSEAKSVNTLLLPGNSIEITGTMNSDFLDYSVKGNYMSEWLSEERKSNKSRLIELSNLENKLDSITYYGADKALASSVEDRYDKVSSEISEYEISYIKDHLNSELSGYLLLDQTIATFGKYYGNLAPSVREGMFKKYLDKINSRYLENKLAENSRKTVTEGSIAPDFTLNSLNGNKISLSNIHSDYVVLDFWGSWCIWCMRGVPQMKEYYKKYNGKLEIIGIACRDKDESWRQCIEKNGMNWIQLFNRPEDKIQILYGVSGYPTKFILDKDHRIVSIFVGESPDFYNKLDELLK